MRHSEAQRPKNLNVIKILRFAQDDEINALLVRDFWVLDLCGN